MSSSTHTPTSTQIRDYFAKHYWKFDHRRHIHRLATREHVAEAVHRYQFQVDEAKRLLWERIQCELTDEEIVQFYLDLSHLEREKIVRAIAESN